MQEQKIKIDLAPEVAKGTFSNLAVITHSPTEIVIDFAQMMPGQEGAIVRERVIMTPIHAKQLLMALEDNVRKYESMYGTIEMPKQKTASSSAKTIPYEA